MVESQTKNESTSSRRSFDVQGGVFISLDEEKCFNVDIAYQESITLNYTTYFFAFLFYAQVQEIASVDFFYSRCF